MAGQRKEGQKLISPQGRKGVSFRAILEEACRQQRLVAVYTSSPTRITSCFSLGRVVSVSSTHYAMALVSPDGEEDGVRAGRFSCIRKVEMDNPAFRGYQDGMTLDGSRAVSTTKRPNTTVPLMMHVLRMALLEREIVTLERGNGGILLDVTGIVSNLVDDCVEVLQIDDDGGAFDGVTTIKIESIRTAKCLTRRERVCTLRNVGHQEDAEKDCGARS